MAIVLNAFKIHIELSIKPSACSLNRKSLIQSDSRFENLKKIKREESLQKTSSEFRVKVESFGLLGTMFRWK